MANPEWSEVTGNEALEIETEFEANHGSLAPVGGVSWENHREIDPERPYTWVFTNPNTGITETFTPTEWGATRTITFSLLFRSGVEPPAARRVIQYCNRCDGHTDTLADAATQNVIGVPFSKRHVGNDQYGERAGNLYMQHRVRGTQYQRTDEITVHSRQGDGPQITISQTGQQQRTVRWKSRTIDATKQGPHIHWLTGMHARPCDEYGLLDTPVEEHLLAVLHDHGFPGDAVLLDDGGAIRDLLAATHNLNYPQFEVGWKRKEGFTIAVSNRDQKGKDRPCGMVKLRQHGKAIYTLVDWKPSK